jgi:septin family protein
MKKIFRTFGIESLNIMVIGPEKCGKGALLNSMKTAIEKKYV